MRIGLNLIYLVRRAGGAGTYARELIPELLRVQPSVSITAFASQELASEDRSSAWGREIQWIEQPVTVTHGSPLNSARSLSTQWLTQARLARRHRLDVIHGPANIAPPVVPGVATVVTLLDLIWLRHRGRCPRVRPSR